MTRLLKRAAIATALAALCGGAASAQDWGGFYGGATLGLSPGADWAHFDVGGALFNSGDYDDGRT